MKGQCNDARKEGDTRNGYRPQNETMCRYQTPSCYSLEQAEQVFLGIKTAQTLSFLSTSAAVPAGRSMTGVVHTVAPATNTG